ncbi:MAG: hypothetical protein ACD_38C00076G0003 [uncultured bacterium]|nr:MAG: hypothetical protein ACD_38C00076G0003 [uncultured bacterium]
MWVKDTVAISAVAGLDIDCAIRKTDITKRTTMKIILFILF